MITTIYNYVKQLTKEKEKEYPIDKYIIINRDIFSDNTTNFVCENRPDTTGYILYYNDINLDDYRFFAFPHTIVFLKKTDINNNIKKTYLVDLFNYHNESFYHQKNEKLLMMEKQILEETGKRYLLQVYKKNYTDINGKELSDNAKDICKKMAEQLDMYIQYDDNNEYDNNEYIYNYLAGYKQVTYVDDIIKNEISKEELIDKYHIEQLVKFTASNFLMVNLNYVENYKIYKKGLV